MWSYYGSKSKVIHLYPKPNYPKIIEPFAGTARYALRWWDRDVLLLDKYEVIVKIWKWLQLCSPNDILKMPTPDLGEKIERESFDCEEAFLLMSFLVQAGVSSPRFTVTSFGHTGSGGIENKKLHISKSLFKIKHWKIQQGDYRELENTEATWFIDPPYQFGGEDYKFGNSEINFCELAQWCKTRKGEAIVCENVKADWLPFLPMSNRVDNNIRGKKVIEAIWTSFPVHYETQQQKLF